MDYTDSSSYSYWGTGTKVTVTGKNAFQSSKDAKFVIKFASQCFYCAVNLTVLLEHYARSIMSLQRDLYHYLFEFETTKETFDHS